MVVVAVVMVHIKTFILRIFNNIISTSIKYYFPLNNKKIYNFNGNSSSEFMHISIEQIQQIFM